jgi:hypothetical protein
MIYVFIGGPHHLTTSGSFVHFIDKRQTLPLWIMRWRGTNKIASINPTTHHKIIKCPGSGSCTQAPSSHQMLKTESSEDASVVPGPGPY